MANKNKIFVDTNDARKRILDCIMSDELEKLVGPTIFNNDDKYIAAIKHGMCLASLLLVDCDSLIIAENENKPKITDKESKGSIYLITKVDFDNMENQIHSAINETPIGVVIGTMYDVHTKIEELMNNVSKYKGWDSIEYPYFEVTELNLL